MTVNDPGISPDCPGCQGSGKASDDSSCTSCRGTGKASGG